MEQIYTKLQSHIQQAESLETARRIDDALAAYDACLELIARAHIPLPGDQLVRIWMGIGFCYADRNDMHTALEWYHRTEAAIQSPPPLNPLPESPEATAHAQKWTPYLPEGVSVLFPEAFPAESHLAVLYDSIALAYDNADQLERAQAYYQRAAQLHAKLGNPAREAEIWQHQAIGCQRRQQWLELEVAATKMLTAATQAQDRPIMLAAQRFLVQSQINQQRPFKTLEHLGQAVLLGREIQDVQVGTDENLLQGLIQNMRFAVLQRGAADFLKPLVYAESIVNDPHLDQDTALLQQWQSEHPAPVLSGLGAQDSLNSLSDVATVLANFASRHCGPQVQTETRRKKGLLGLLGNATEDVEHQVWAVTQERVPILENVNGQVIQKSVDYAILTLFGQPEAIISISLASSMCQVAVMEERTLPGVRQPGFVSVARESVPAQFDALSNLLNGFIQQGLFVKADAGLKYVSPK